jgi:hypothetical protein
MLRSPEGKQRADQWFAGYRQGAGVARDGGYRDLGMVHTSLLGFAEPPARSVFPPADGFYAPDSDVELHDSEALPEPGTAPQLPSPFNSDQSPSQSSESELEAEPPSVTPPALGDEPFRDDPEPPVEETNSESRPIDETSEIEQSREEAEAVDADIPLDESGAETFDVQRAILLKLSDNGERQMAKATEESAPSTVKFVIEPAIVNENSPAPQFGAIPGNQLRSTTAGPPDTNEEVHRFGFRGWSRRATVETMQEE